MLFIGYFSFDEINSEGTQKHGYFSTIADAETPEKAVAKFEACIRDMKNTLSEMNNVANVYIEEILKVTSIPKTPIITRLQSSEGTFPLSASYSLPGVDIDGIEAFGFTPDVVKQETADTDTFVEAKPFISFRLE